MYPRNCKEKLLLHYEMLSIEVIRRNILVKIISKKKKQGEGEVGRKTEGEEEAEGEAEKGEKEKRGKKREGGQTEKEERNLTTEKGSD